GWARRLNPARCPPMSSTSSRCRMPMNAWPGVRLWDTSAPSALVFTASMKLLMTGKATSASRSATRTSRRASPMFSSVIRPRPRRESRVRERRLLRVSNMDEVYWKLARKLRLNDSPSSPVLLIVLLALLTIIAFSSGTEVAMLSVNRYRIRHRAKAGQSTAKLLERLLQKPQDWLGANLVILAAASVFASATATLLAQRTGYKHAVPVTGFLLTVAVIVFCELAPKIYAATY